MSRVAKKGGASRKRYSAEFKKEALGLAGRIGVAKAAAELGLAEAQVYGWRRQVTRQAERSDAERELETEVARLKRQVAEQSEELAILKKAAAYFARSLK